MAKKQQKRKKQSTKQSSLADIVHRQKGGVSGYALAFDENKSSQDENDEDSVKRKQQKRHRIFATPSNRIKKTNKNNPYLTHGSHFTLSSAPRNNTKYTTSESKNAEKDKTTYKPKYQRIGSSYKRHKKTSDFISPSSNIRHHIVCSISENLARETCVSSLDAGLPIELQVTKQANGQNYTETLSYLDILKPNEILFNEGRRNSQLVKKILNKYMAEEDNSSVLCNDRATPGCSGSMECKSSTVVKFVPRHYFDQTRGAELLKQICHEDTYDASVMEEYIILASSHAVLQYTQICLGGTFAKYCMSLHVNSGGHHRMTIDRNSIHHLELLSNAKTRKIANSLVGTIDCTKTSVGARLLRTNIIAPPVKIQTIEARLDLVDTLLEDEDFFYAVMEHLEGLPDIDKMLAHMALVPKPNRSRAQDTVTMNSDRPFVTARIASKGISALVCIKSALSVIPSFVSVIETQLERLELIDKRTREQEEKQHDHNIQQELKSRDRNDSSAYVTPKMNTTYTNKSNDTPTLFSSQQHQLLRAILSSMRHPALEEVLNAVTDIFTESTTYSRNAHAMRHQECFALKPNTDGMMDVLRKAFLANVDDIYRLADEYAEELGIHISVKETSNRGYYLSVPGDVANDMPAILIQPVRSGRFIHCTTEETLPRIKILSLNSRAQENVQDLLIMTHNRIQEVIDIARSRYDSLASLSDAIALLDMCHCFADNVASSRLPWCRPIVTDYTGDGASGAISIRGGRYGIDVSSTGLMRDQEFIPNDTYASSVQNFTVITGINGSGKSTYLKQIAIIVILAHCGSYVPAEDASIPIRDRICTRIGSSDDQEHNISTFMLEMKETSFICNNATNKSLILIDELGRATSNEDGVAIAWSISEFLLVKRAMTFFVTHYTQLSKLAEVYPNVQNQHLSSTTTGEDIKYTHKIMPGPCKVASDYGVEMAQVCGWPMDVVNEARLLRFEVEKKLPDGTLCGVMHGPNMELMGLRSKAEGILHELAKHLVALKESEGQLSATAHRNYLQDLRDRVVPSDNQQIVNIIKALLIDDDMISIGTKSESEDSKNSNANLIQKEKSNSSATNESAQILSINTNTNVNEKKHDLKPKILQSSLNSKDLLEPSFLALMENKVKMKSDSSENQKETPSNNGEQRCFASREDFDSSETSSISSSTSDGQKSDQIDNTPEIKSRNNFSFNNFSDS